MRRLPSLVLVGLLLAGGFSACTPAGTLDGEAPASETAGSTEAADVPVPSFTLLGIASQYQAIATFRAAEDVALGDSAAVFEIGGDTYRAPLTSGPSRFQEPQGAAVTQATYTLEPSAYQALLATPADSVVVRMQIGGMAHAFPFRRGDLVE